MTPEKQISLRNKIQSTEERLRQLKIQERQLEQKLRTIASEKSRKAETRKKIIIGAITMNEIETDPSLKAVFLQKIDSMLQKASDRKLFNLSPKKESGS